LIFNSSSNATAVVDSCVGTTGKELTDGSTTDEGLTKGLVVILDVVEEEAIVAMVIDGLEEVGGVNGGLSGIVIGVSLDVGETGGLE
jgi:hypothetical protein